MSKYIANSRLVLVGLGLALAGTAQAAFSPIPITPDSYSQDVVVEQTATPKLKVVTTASVDQGTNNGAATWMEAGFDRANPARGLPVAGSTFTAQDNANYSFKMAPDYTAPNGILIDNQVPGGTFTLTTPAAYAKLSFLTSGGNGGHTVGVTVHHQDGSTETGSFTSPDWFNGSGIAVTAGGRVDTSRNFNIQDNGQNPRLYFRDVTLTNTTSPVTSIDLYYVSGNNGAHSDVVGVSGATTAGGAVTPITVTGYTYDFIIEKEAPNRGRIVSTTIVSGTNALATTQTLENQANTSWTFYEKGFNINNPAGNGPAPNPAALNTGLPAAGSNVTNALGDHIFTMPASYTTNNACYLTTVLTNRTITFVSPTTASVLSFLCTAGGGAATVDVVIHHQNGSSETNVVVIPDWFDTAANAVIKADGRVSVDNADFSSATLNANGTKQPWLNNVDLLADGSSPITSIDLTHRTTGGQVAIFAVSGTTDATLPVFVTNPQSKKVNVGDNVSFVATAVANVAISYQWQVGTNGVFVNLADGAGVSGATTTNLMLTSVLDQDYPTYRCVATDSAGSATSGTANLLVISALQNVVLAGDLVAPVGPPGFVNNFPAAENPPKAIDQTTSKYLHFGNNGTPFPGAGFTVAPSQGRSIVTALRLTRANDAPDRNPANVILEGSKDAGATWTLIYSNNISMAGLPDNTSGQGLDPLNQSIAQVRFNNTNSYTSYRWTTTKLQGNVSLMQIGEVEFLGVLDTSDPSPYFATQPTSMAVYDQSSVFFSVYAIGTPNPDYIWQKGTNGVYVDLVDGGNITGSHSSGLSINPVTFSDAADYRCLATNSAGSNPSGVAKLLVVSTGVDVTMPTDPIVGFGDTTGTRYGDNTNAANAIDDFNTVIYINGGSGISAPAGFPPFSGPVGLVVTPAAGSTKLSGIRIYTSTEGSGRDPIDYILEGSNNGGGSYTIISQGALNLPLGRADNNFAFDPTQQPMQEILFSNNASYSSYRLTFNHTRDDANESALSIGEIELLGVVTGAPQPVLSIKSNGSGGFTIESTAAGSVYSATNLSGTVNWVLEGSTPLNITPQPGDAGKFYQIRP